MNVDFSVLNQKGSPALYGSALADRPAAGFIGRLFIDTDNPSTGIYRDTGAAWISLSGGGGGGITGGGNASFIPIFTGTVPGGSTDIANSLLFTYDPTPGVPAIIQASTNTKFQIAYLNAQTNEVGYEITEGFATGFGFYRTPGTPIINNIYSGSTDMRIKVFDGATDYYHSFFKNGRIVINGTTDTGYQFRVNGTTYFNGNSVHIGTITANNTISAGDGTITVAMSYSASTGIMGTSSNHDLDIRTNNTNSLRVVKTTNRLLIATTTDAGAYNLQVAGTSYFAGNIRPDSIANNRSIGGSGFAFSAVHSRNLYLGAGATSTIYGGTFGDVAAAISVNNNVIICGGNNNTTEISSLAALQFNNITTKGMLLPRLTTAQRTAIGSPPNGLMVFDTDLSHICFYDTAGSPGWRKLSYSNA